MRFTAQEEYGLRCLLQMARHGPSGSMTIAEIARAEALTPAYVGKIMGILRHEGLVTSHRGQAGGYRLARLASEIRVGNALSALGGDLYTDDHCGRFTGHEDACVHTVDCSIRSLLMGLQGLVERVLRGTTLQDLVATEQAMGARVHEQAAAGGCGGLGGGCGCASTGLAAEGPRAVSVPVPKTPCGEAPP